MGGTGSTFLRSTLAANAQIVHDKPDTVFRRQWLVRAEDEREREFSRRAHGYQLRARPSIMDIANYLDHISTYPNTVGVLNTWAEQHIVSACGERRIVFILRDPLSAYRSLCEPQRHGDDAERYGGPDSWFAVMVANRWMSIATEYLRLKDLGWPVSLWPYESLNEAAEADGIKGVFSGWRPSLYGSAHLVDPMTSDTVRAVTHDLRDRLGISAWC